MNVYEIEVKVKLRVNAFDASDATDAVEEVIRETEGLGAQIENLSFTSIREV